MQSKRNGYEVSSPEVSARMRRIKSKGTDLERTFERILRSDHIKFKRQPRLLGRPDFQIRGTNVLIFCDSSFWHGRREKELNGSAFSTNKRLWKEKLFANKKRDARVNRILRRHGWSVQRFWDTDILHKPEKVRARLERILSNEKVENENVKS